MWSGCNWYCVASSSSFGSFGSSSAYQVKAIPRFSFALFLQTPQRHPRRVVAAHTVHSAAWWCRRRAEKKRGIARGIKPPARTQEELQPIDRAARNVAAFEIPVHVLQVRRWKDTPCQYALAKTSSEALHLRFHAGR